MPALSRDGPTGVKWVWTDTNPDSWHLDDNPGGTGWYIDVDSVTGSLRNMDEGETGTFQRIWGADSGGSQITPYSNVVAIP